jgi:hypothetical protein
MSSIKEYILYPAAVGALGWTGYQGLKMKGYVDYLR